MQGLIDDEIVNLRISSDSFGEDTSLEQNYIDDPMCSSGSITSSTSSKTHASPNTSNLSNMPPSNKKSGAFHMQYVYPQGLPLKETQANLHFPTNSFHATKPKDRSTSPSTTSFTLHSPFSLEVAPCQEDTQKEKVINVKKDQDQAPFHLLQNLTPLYPMSFPSPKYDEDTTSTISLEFTENYEKIYLPMLSKATLSRSKHPLMFYFSISTSKLRSIFKCSY